MGLPRLDVVLGLAAGTIDILVDGTATHAFEAGDDEACVDALRPASPQTPEGPRGGLLAFVSDAFLLRHADAFLLRR